MRQVSDSDTVRRQNRALVLKALREEGAQSRTQLAATTGLSNASITAITQDMLAQGVLTLPPDNSPGPLKQRGRPAVRIGFDRRAASLVLIEIDVNRLRFSLVAYDGTLIDRMETARPPGLFSNAPPLALLEGPIETMRQRNVGEFAVLRRIAVSVQGILDRDATGLIWSPVEGLQGQPLATQLRVRFKVPVKLHKRGPLLAEGTRWLDPRLRDVTLATVFVGSTVAMGISDAGTALGRGGSGGTEFGHMNHVPNGALCRCGMRGCIEAYAADYGLLRAAYSVPDSTPPAASVPEAQYEDLIRRARGGDRQARNAFHLAGRAIGFGIARLLALVDLNRVVVVGPGTRALDLMGDEIDAALAGALVCRVNGAPQVVASRDEIEPIFAGLLMKSLAELDQEEFAPIRGQSAAAAG